ncbi:hypothetical protein ON010_g8874 [Phytophthora cinnamomi]|nr:hypothetical protein ON010_g8874 [Phytophthora cinnamomi]
MAPMLLYFPPLRPRGARKLAAGFQVGITAPANVIELAHSLADEIQALCLSSSANPLHMAEAVTFAYCTASKSFQRRCTHASQPPSLPLPHPVTASLVRASEAKREELNTIISHFAVSCLSGPKLRGDSNSAVSAVPSAARKQDQDRIPRFEQLMALLERV